MPPNSVEQLGMLLALTARAWRYHLDQRLRPLGLSIGKWTTLVHLARGGDKLTQKEVAARVGIEEPTLAGILDRLQHDGWIKRKNHVGDRRCKTVHLQPRAAIVLDNIFSTARGLREELLADIPKRDLEKCVSVLAKIQKRAETISLKSVRNGTEHRNGKNGLTRSQRT
ncbi:MAG: MarR family winged helix-turn-helix transcriptional regulator [Chthoniobacterales bacterium]